MAQNVGTLANRPEMIGVVDGLAPGRPLNGGRTTICLKGECG
jgi:hypothetical protein